MRYYDDTLEHSRGKSPKQKAREREHNQGIADKSNNRRFRDVEKDRKPISAHAECTKYKASKELDNAKKKVDEFLSKFSK